MVIRLIRNDISPSIRRYAAEMRKGLRETVHDVARAITRKVMEVTPPASQGASGAAAYRQGRLRIQSDMEGVLFPVKLKGRRKITTVFGHHLKRPVYVPTREKYPDVAGVYRQNMRFRNLGVGARSTNLRDRKYHVDARKFAAELKRRQARVGLLASGWAAAAAALDVPVQNWISRHGTSAGRVQIDTAGEKMRIIVENLAPNASENVRQDLARRIPYVVEAQRASMERQIEAYHNRVRQQLAVKAA